MKVVQLQSIMKTLIILSSFIAASLANLACINPALAVQSCLESSTLGPKLGDAFRTCEAGPYKRPSPVDFFGFLFNAGLSAGQNFLGICPPPLMLTIGFGLKYGGQIKILLSWSLLRNCFRRGLCVSEHWLDGRCWSYDHGHCQCWYCHSPLGAADHTGHWLSPAMCSDLGSSGHR